MVKKDLQQMNSIYNMVFKKVDEKKVVTKEIKVASSFSLSPTINQLFRKRAHGRNLFSTVCKDTLSKINSNIAVSNYMLNIFAPNAIVSPEQNVK